MYHDDLPGISDHVRQGLREYAAAHAQYMSSVMEANFADQDSTSEDSPRVAVDELARAYERLVDLAPEGVPGRDGVSYSALLAFFREHDLASRNVRSPEEPPLPLAKLPSPQGLLHAMVDLDYYLFLTRGFEKDGRGEEPLFDLPAELRDAMSEEEIAGTHGDRNELFVRLDRILTALEDDSPEARRRNMFGMGYECGSESAVFYRLYEREPDYLDGFVQGALEYLGEGSEEDEQDAAKLLALWEEPSISEEEKIGLVLEPLLEACEVRDGEDELWRL